MIKNSNDKTTADQTAYVPTNGGWLRSPGFCSMVKLLCLLGFFLFSSTGCKKLVEVDAPPTSINAANVYSTDATAISVLTGLYTQLNAASTYLSLGPTTLSGFTGLSSDELSLYSGSTNASMIAYYTNSITTTNGSQDYYSKIYPYIYTTNSAIEGLGNATSLTPAVKQQLLGEAKFMRAFFYFYLVNLYGDVPLAVSTDYTKNAVLSRSPKMKVYEQIISDLTDAQALLSSGYLDATVLTSSAERLRPNKSAAAALLARAYLFAGDYANAEIQATAVISNTSLYSLSTLANTFSKASLSNNEAILQWQPVNTGWNTEDAKFFIIPSAGLTVNNPVSINSRLLNSFETGENRKTSWLGSINLSGSLVYFPNKYKVNTQNAAVTEYLMVLRLGEQYLIRAEARTQLGTNLAGAIADLNTIRTRAGLPGTTATDKASLLSAILHERQVELFTEWGHRWLDLKRTGNVDAVMSVATPAKGGVWNTNWQLYPIPLASIQTDPNLVQNPGY